LPNQNDSLAGRLAGIQSRFDAAFLAAGRNPDAGTLIVVTKNHPAQLVIDLLELGCRDFGENRDQEAAPKAKEVADSVGEGLEYRWHFIGQLQSNKVRSVLQYSRVIHSLDRASLLTALGKEVERKLEVEPEYRLGVFIQLNLTDDPARGGIQPANLLDFASQVSAFNGIDLLGVMGVASLDRQPEEDFETIRRCSEQLVGVYPQAGFISAGMSQDFEAAIKFGATHVRIGTAITGTRV
jgi:hypothetical protein